MTMMMISNNDLKRFDDLPPRPSTLALARGSRIRGKVGRNVKKSAKIVKRKTREMRF